jgi:hypothetical protein
MSNDSIRVDEVEVDAVSEPGRVFVRLADIELNLDRETARKLGRALIFGGDGILSPEGKMSWPRLPQ